jgi:DNA gyrase subunit A
MAIRFTGDEVRPMGLVAAGVNAIKLPAGSFAIGMLDLNAADELLFIAADGLGWRVAKDDFPVQGRYGQGVIIGRLKPNARLVGLISGKKNQNITVFMQKSASKMIRLDVITKGKRGSSGKVVLEVKVGDQVINLAKPIDESDSWAKKTPENKKEKSPVKKVPNKKYKQGKIL